MFFNVPIPSHIHTDADKIAFYIGSYHVAWYGIFVFIGFFVSILLATLKIKFWYKIKTDPFYYFCVIGIFTSILGARFWSCCLGDASWNNFLDIHNGGLAIQGGVVATIIAACFWFPYSLHKPENMIRDEFGLDNKPVIRQVSMWIYADAIIPCILVGQFIGRWGNYFNQELYGAKITNENFMLWLCKYLPYMYKNGAYYQPLFLYEGLINLVGFLILYFCLEFVKQIKAGTIGVSYILWYGIVRLCLESLRDHMYSFPATYILSGIWISISVLFIVLNQINIIKKTRYYKCKFVIYEELSFLFFNIWHKIFKKVKNDNLNYIKTRNERHEKNKNLYKRDDNSFLYYLNK